MAIAEAAPVATLDWLLDAQYPAVRLLGLRRVLGRPESDTDVARLLDSLADDPWIRILLGGEIRSGVEGCVPVHPYKKWGGAHWRLIALAELGVTSATPGVDRAIEAAFELTMKWLNAPGRKRRIRPLEGRYRVCASQEGGALWAASTIGLGRDERLDDLANRLVTWQWPDGGWNCDIRPEAAHASFNESWMPLRGLVAFRAARRGRPRAAPEIPGNIDEAIARSVEFFLRHRVVESERTGEVANPRVELLRWPPYWRYGLVPGLRALAEAGFRDDPRVRPALRRLADRRRPDGRWWPEGRWWSAPGSRGSNVEIVDWGEEGEARMLTLHGLQLLGEA
jgi:hypothetical protein